MTPPGYQVECIGRLVFNTKDAIRWPTSYDMQSRSHWAAIFTPNVRMDDAIEIGQPDQKFGRVRIAVFEGTDSNVIKLIKQDLPSVEAEFYSENIALSRRILAKLRRSPPSDSNSRSIRLEEGLLRGYEASLDAIKLKKFPFQTGRSDSEGYGEVVQQRNDDPYSKLRAYITVGSLVFVLESTRRIDGQLTRVGHTSEFSAMLKRFRLRVPGEVPSEPGICIPFGFLPDDGSTKVDIKQSFRFADAPNVVHTIGTGNYERMRGSPPGIRAAALASTGLLGSPDEEQLKSFITNRIGPRPYKIGGLTGIQGGYAAKISLKGHAPFENYSVLTGYRGWEGSDALPFIVVEMSAKLKMSAPELKDDPPPFARSMARHEALLKTIRLRNKG